MARIAAPLGEASIRASRAIVVEVSDESRGAGALHIWGYGAGGPLCGASASAFWTESVDFALGFAASGGRVCASCGALARAEAA